MNIEHLRRALKSEWLTYYRTNRQWIIRLGVWVNCQGQRRPSSSFILGALSTLEPQLTELLPLVVDLSCHPDRIVIALGLNFNPEDELAALAEVESPPTRIVPARAVPTRTVSTQTVPTQTVPIEPQPAISAPLSVSSAPAQAPRLLPSGTIPDLSYLGHQAAVAQASGPQATGPQATGPQAAKELNTRGKAEARSQIDSSDTNSSGTNSSDTDSIGTGHQSKADQKADKTEAKPNQSVAKSAESTTQSTAQPAKKRRALDTAKLGTHELPDRDTTPRRSRTRKSSPSP